MQDEGQTEMAWRIRSSKYRHVFGSPAKKEQCYECIKITKNAHDSNFCAANPKFVAVVTESAGGGSFLVFPVSKTGRVDINCPKVCGHSGPVLDVKWNPFSDHVIASCSDDATIKLWQIPEDGLKSNLTEWLVDLHGHQRRVGYIEWHPTAENILLSAGYDFQCIIWNTERAEPINIVSCHTDTIFSIAWSRDGSMFATTSKDKKLRVIDPRDGSIISEGPGHQGTKASKVTFLGDNNRILTAGFSKMSDRQYCIWDYKNLSKPLKTENIDSSSGVIMPYFDYDTGVVYLAGKGDGNIRYYEIVNEAPYCHYLSQYQSGSPQRGLGIMCKRGVDTSKCEIMRFYKLHTSKNMVEPVAMIVPRKSEMFQEDIYPPTASSCPSLTADEWISGVNRDPILVSLKDQQIVVAPQSRTGKAVRRQVTGRPYSPVSSAMYMPPGPGHYHTENHRTNPHTSEVASRLPTPSQTITSKTSSSTKIGSTTPKTSHTRKRSDSPKNCTTPKRSVSQIRTQFMPKDGIISQSPTITTYKAVKRGSSLMDTGTGSTANTKRNTALGRSVSLSAASSEKLPMSVRNIQKLSSVEEKRAKDPVGSDPDKVIIYDTKRPVTQTESTTRYTNNNSPIRVDKKTWQSAYTSGSIDTPTANGVMPKTDPELKSEQSIHLSSRPNMEPTVDTSSSPFRRSASLRGSRIKLGRTMYEQEKKIPEEPLPYTRDNGDIRLQSTGSVSSDHFYTPPSSPQRAVSSVATPGDNSPFTNGTPVRSLWAENPLYGGNRSTTNNYTSNNNHSKPVSRSNADIDTTPLDDILSDVLKDFESTASNLGAPSSAKNSNFPNPMKKAVSQYFQAKPAREDADLVQTSHLAKSENNIERNMAPEGKGMIPGGKGTIDWDSHPPQSQVSQADTETDDLDKQAMLDCISVDAPDDTLIKPSKLRASMRSRKARTSFRGGSRSSPDSDLPSPGTETPTNYVSPLASPRIYSASSNDVASGRSYQNGQAHLSSSQPAELHINEIPSMLSCRPELSSYTSGTGSSGALNHDYKRKDSSEINNNKTRFVRRTRRDERSKTDVCAFPRESEYSQPMSNGRPHKYSHETTSDLNTDKLVFKLNSEAQDSLLLTETNTALPSYMSRSSFRSQPRSARSKSEPEIDDVNSSHHVKKVWAPPQVQPTPLPHTLTNGMPHTDLELRKAYFRQLEEIRSLKEEISMKDKRIRQLEDEVKCLKPGEGNESNC